MFQVHGVCQNGELIQETLVGTLVCGDQIKIIGIGKGDDGRVLEVIAQFSVLFEQVKRWVKPEDEDDRRGGHLERSHETYRMRRKTMMKQ